MIRWKGKYLCNKNWHQLFPFCTLILTLKFFFCRFTVEADEPIEALTIIAEYVGDVDYVKNREDDEGNNNIMTLLYASDPSQSLIICPDKRSNLARFISGINNDENVPFLLILSG